MGVYKNTSCQQEGLKKEQYVAIFFLWERKEADRTSAKKVLPEISLRDNFKHLNPTDHGHEVVDTLDSGRVGEEIHDEVPEVRGVGLGHDLHRGLHVLTLDSQERVAGQGWK